MLLRRDTFLPCFVRATPVYHPTQNGVGQFYFTLGDWREKKRFYSLHTTLASKADI